MSTRSDRMGGPSNDGMATRGLLLLGVLVALGFLVLWRAFDGGGDDDVATNSDTTEVSDGSGTTGSTAAGDTTTSTTLAPTTVAPIAPSSVSVIAANGTTQDGLARRTGESLTGAGFLVQGTTNAVDRATATSAVYFTAPEHQAAAELVASALTIPLTQVLAMPTPAPVPDPGTAMVIVVMGADRATG
jgi:hypothetical protein